MVELEVLAVKSEGVIEVETLSGLKCYIAEGKWYTRKEAEAQFKAYLKSQGAGDDDDSATDVADGSRQGDGDGHGNEALPFREPLDEQVVTPVGEQVGGEMVLYRVVERRATARGNQEMSAPAAVTAEGDTGADGRGSRQPDRSKRTAEVAFGGQAAPASEEEVLASLKALMNQQLQTMDSARKTLNRNMSRYALLSSLVAESRKEGDVSDTERETMEAEIKAKVRERRENLPFKQLYAKGEEMRNALETVRRAHQEFAAVLKTVEEVDRDAALRSEELQAEIKELDAEYFELRNKTDEYALPIRIPPSLALWPRCKCLCSQVGDAISYKVEVAPCVDSTVGDHIQNERRGGTDAPFPREEKQNAHSGVGLVRSQRL